jgi:hypothetical protein
MVEKATTSRFRIVSHSCGKNREVMPVLKTISQLLAATSFSPDRNASRDSLVSDP